MKGVVLVGALLVAGCSTSSVPLDEVRFACNSSADCASGSVCHERECLAEARLPGPDAGQPPDASVELDAGLFCPREADSAFCARFGRNCGSFGGTDTCGLARTADCGSCGGSDTCGGGGVASVCGCPQETPEAFCARLGKDCGSVTAPDQRCGVSHTVSCGRCTAPKSCGAGGAPNRCGCNPESDAALCARSGKDCGLFAAQDNCGAARVADCGACTAGATCGQGTPNVCGSCSAPESDAAVCARYRYVCGSLTGTDSCGAPRTVSCGAPCTGGLACVGGTCGCRKILETCAGDSDCCGSLCRNSLCCVDLHGSCSDDSECCHGDCAAGKCCLSKGQPCAVASDCCSNTCTAGKCVVVF